MFLMNPCCQCIVVHVISTSPTACVHVPPLTIECVAVAAGVLAEFRELRDTDRPRGDYVECLAQDMADYYGYNRELVRQPVCACSCLSMTSTTSSVHNAVCAIPRSLGTLSVWLVAQLLPASQPYMGAHTRLSNEKMMRAAYLSVVHSSLMHIRTLSSSKHVAHAVVLLARAD